MSVKTIANALTVQGAGGWADINPAKARTVQVVITGVATVDIEGSNDRVNPVVLQAGITASSGFSDSEPWHFLRVNVKSIASGSVTVILGEA